MSRVLILEQDLAASDYSVSCFGKVGIRAHITRSILEFLNILSSFDPALVCFEMEKIDKQGMVAIALWRKRNPQKPLIITAQNDSREKRNWAEKIHASAFLPKPYSNSRFFELVVNLVKQTTSKLSKNISNPSVMMYSHDTIGLGHMRRNSSIASNLTTMNKTTSVLMLVGSPTGAFFELEAGVDFIKLPSLIKVGQNQWQPSSLRVPPRTARELRTSLILNSIETFKPDVFLVDHEPTGVWGELIPALKQLRKHENRTRVILGLRDILDTPNKTIDTWQSNGVYGLIKNYYDDILIYGEKSFFDTGKLYKLDECKPGRVHYCGHVCSIDQCSQINNKRAGILVSCGGGRDAAPILRLVIEGLKNINCDKRPNVTLISGPLMDADVRNQIFTEAKKLNIECYVSVNDLPERLKKAALFITMGGYNSLTEAVASGVPTFAIPRTGPSCEQKIRTSKLAALGLIKSDDIGDLTKEKVSELLLNPAICQSDNQIKFKLNGAANAANFISSSADENEKKYQYKIVENLMHG